MKKRSSRPKTELLALEPAPLVVTCHEVAALPEDLRQLVEQILIEGGTFEDAVEAVKARSDTELALLAVRSFFRSRLDVQTKRVRRLVENFQKLKADFKDPESVEGQVAEATLFQAFLGLNRPTREMEAARAHKMHMELENLRLRVRNMALKEQRAREMTQLHHLRLRHDAAKIRLVRERLNKMRSAAKAGGQNRKLGGEALRTIQEIYGIVNEPFMPPPSLLNAPEGAFAQVDEAPASEGATPAPPLEGDIIERSKE